MVARAVVQEREAVNPVERGGLVCWTMLDVEFALDKMGSLSRRASAVVRVRSCIETVLMHGVQRKSRREGSVVHVGFATS
mmetsp:Transcript_4820/g.9075  ORF Transcript_4820/g.9075 Transcript_4820/m.9075 type:complete len:80 (-) Transcript_4820:113-352(-)